MNLLIWILVIHKIHLNWWIKNIFYIKVLILIVHPLLLHIFIFLFCQYFSGCLGIIEKFVYFFYFFLCNGIFSIYPGQKIWWCQQLNRISEEKKLPLSNNWICLIFNYEIKPSFQFRNSKFEHLSQYNISGLSWI